MRAFVGSLVVIGLVATSTHGGDRQDQLFASWQKAQREVKSLVVQFSLETRDRIFDVREKAEGTFRLIRTPKDEVFASYEVSALKANAEKQERWSGLLNNGTVYYLNHEKKTALRFDVTGELQQFLEQNFNPFVRLLDRKRAEENCQLEVKQDERYTYLAVKPKQVKQWVSSSDIFRQGRVVLMNKASERVPKDMPRQFWYIDVVSEYTFEINSWRLNGAEAPKLEEFAKPEDRPGWQVSSWPFQGKK